MFLHHGLCVEIPSAMPNSAEEVSDMEKSLYFPWFNCEQNRPDVNLDLPNCVTVKVINTFLLILPPLIYERFCVRVLQSIGMDGSETTRIQA